MRNFILFIKFVLIIQCKNSFCIDEYSSHSVLEEDGPLQVQKLSWAQHSNQIRGESIPSTAWKMDTLLLSTIEKNKLHRVIRSTDEVPESLVDRYLQIHPTTSREQARQAVALMMSVLMPKTTQPPTPSENCQVLNVTSTKKPIVRESLQTILEKGSKKLVLSEKKDVILILGNTGSGKTTLTQILSGDLSKIHAVETSAGQMVIIDDEQRIGLPSTKSKTLVPELIMNSNSSVAFYDCPGFSDSRGVEIDIAATYFTKKVTDHVTNVKLLFLVLSSSVQLGNDRLDFDLLVKHAVKFVKNLDKFKDAIGLIVTKVNNYSHERGIYLSDEDILAKVVEFLKQYKSLQETSLDTSGISSEEKENVQKRIQFLDIILQQDSNGNYTKIGFSRTPDKCGALNEIPVVASSKERLTQMYEKLEYVAKVNEDFGYTLRPESQLKVIDIVSSMNSEIVDMTNITVADFFINRKKQARKLKDINLNGLSSATRNECKVLSELMTELKGLSDPTHFASQIGQSLFKLNFTVSRNFIQSLSRRGDYLTFFETVTEKKVQRDVNDWINPLVRLENHICALTEWYKFLESLQLKLSEFNVQRNRSLNGGYKASENDLDFASNTLMINVNHEVFDKILESPRGFVEKERLKNILEFGLQDPKVSCLDNGKRLVVRGNYILVSDFIYAGSVRMSQCRSCNIIQVIATDTLFIDDSIDGLGKELQISFISPKWEVHGERLINLDGLKGNSIDEAEPTIEDMPGESGEPGEHGGNGGLFFGVGDEFINGDRLKVTANGGDGGNGQPGANGANGARGKDMTYDKFPSCLKRDCPNQDKIVSTVVYNHDGCQIAGSRGSPGKDGGDGGSGGIGGHNGVIDILELGGKSKIHVKNYPGSRGEDGVGGKGGRGGQSGNSLRCYRWDVVYYLACGYTAKECDSIESSIFARSGSRGIAGFNKNNKAEPNQNTYDLKYWKYINEFKRVVSISKSPKGREFSKDLESSKRVLYNTEAYSNELLGLEKCFYTFTKKINLLPYYESFLKRLDAYVKNPKHSEINLTYKKVWNILHASALSKLCALAQKPGTAVVTDDTKSYFDNVKSKLNTMKHSALDTISSEQSQFYGTQVTYKIQEFLEFIRESILPAVDEIDQEIDEQIEDVMKYALDFPSEGNRRFQGVLKWKKIFLGLKSIDKFTSFLGVIAPMTWFSISSQPMIPDPFRFDEVTQVASQASPLPGVQETFGLIKDRLQKEKDARVHELRTKIDLIATVIQSNPTDFEKLESTLDYYRQKLNEFESDPDSGLVTDGYFWKPKQLTEMHRSLDKSLTEILLELDENSHDNNIESGSHESNILNRSDQALVVARARKATLLIEMGLNATYNFASDTAELFEIADVLINGNSSLENIRKLEEEIHMHFIPSVYKIDSALFNKTDGTQALSLHVNEWQIERTIFEMKRMMKSFIEEDKVQEKFVHLIQQLDEGLTKLSNLYDTIEKYEANKQLADFVGNIYSDKSMGIHFFDHDLSLYANELESFMGSSLFLAEYRKTVYTFQQWVFPFAHFYIEDFELPSNLSKISKATDVGYDVTFFDRKVDNLKLRLSEYKNRIVKNLGQDTYVFQTRFTSSLQSSSPFYTWKNEKWSHSIKDILAGRKVQMKAGVAESDSFKGAIKFQRIELNFKHRDPEKQRDLDGKLKHCRVTMTHIGTSYFRFQGDYFVMHGESKTIQYNFEKDGDNRLGTNTIYDKAKNGDYLMSPYTLWTIQLSKANQHNAKFDFSDLEEFSQEVDVELVGTGTYVDERLAGLFNLEVDRYYQIDETIFKDSHEVEVGGISSNK